MIALLDKLDREHRGARSSSDRADRAAAPPPPPSNPVELARELHADIEPRVASTFNLAPTQPTIIVVPGEERPLIEPATWGWTRTAAPTKTRVNGRPRCGRVATTRMEAVMSLRSMVRVAVPVALLLVASREALAERCVTCWANGCDPAMRARLPACDPVAEQREADRKLAEIQARFRAQEAAYQAQLVESDRRLAAQLDRVARAGSPDEKARTEGELEALLGERRRAREARLQAAKKANAAAAKVNPVKKQCDPARDPLCNSGL